MHRLAVHIMAFLAKSFYSEKLYIDLDLFVP